MLEKIIKILMKTNGDEIREELNNMHTGEVVLLRELLGTVMLECNRVMMRRYTCKPVQEFRFEKREELRKILHRIIREKSEDEYIYVRVENLAQELKISKQSVWGYLTAYMDSLLPKGWRMRRWARNILKIEKWAPPAREGT